MPSTGYMTDDLPEIPTFDTLIGHSQGSLGQVSLASLMAMLAATNGPKYATEAELMADLAWPTGTFGVVYGATFGLYLKSGAQAAGAWTLVGSGDLSPAIAVALAQAARAQAEAARDAATVNAAVYASASAAQADAGLAVGAQYQVVSGDEIIRYSKDSTTASTEVARYPTVAAVADARACISPIFAESILLRDAGAASLVSYWTRDVVSITDADLTAMGISYAVRLDDLAVAEPCGGVVNIPSAERGWGVGDWVALSVLVKTSDWAGLDTSRLRLFTFNRTGGHQQAYAVSSYEEIRSDLRRYHAVIKLTNANITDLSQVFVEVTGKAGRAAEIYVTGFMVGLSETRPGGLLWRSAPAALVKRDAIDTDIAAALLRGSIIKSQLARGNLPGGETSNVGANAGSTVVAVTDAILNALGCSHAMASETLATVQDTYGKLVVPRRLYRSGCWVALSVLVKTSDWTGLDTARLRALCIPAAGGGAQKTIAIPATSYEELRSDLRRYYHVAQIPDGITDLGQIWIEVTAKAARAAPVFVTGYTCAVSDVRPSAIDWRDWDPYLAADHERRLGAVETAVTQSSQSTPLFLLPSSFHLVQGRPLTLFRHGLSEGGRSNPLEITIKGKAGTRPFVARVGETIDLDGSRLTGAGFVYARPKFAETPIWRRPITFYSTPASRTGSPRILAIGDSLTQQGTVSAMAAKLVSAGMTPTFIGTVKDNGGTWCEGRPSWEFSDFTRRHLFIDAANPLSGGATPTWPIDAAGGNGVVSTVAQYLALGDSANYGPRWMYNPFIRPSTGGDAAGIIRNGYVWDLGFYLSRFGFSTPDLVLISLGTNDLNSNSETVAATNIADGLAIMVAMIKAAAPAAKIGISFKDRGSKANVAIKAAIDAYADREAEGIFLLPIYAALDDVTIYPVTVAETDAYGVQRVTLSDGIHPDEVGREQWAEMTAAWVMCQAN